MCLAFGVDEPRRARREARRDPRAAAAAGARRQGALARQAQVDRRLDAEGGLEGALPGGRPHRRRRRPRPAADPALLAARPGAVHHPARRDHEGPGDRRAQRRHVPDAEDRRALDVHALADPQGRPRRPARRARRADPGRGRDRARPGHRLLGERAAAEARRRADAGRLPQGLAGRSSSSARPSTSQVPANAEIVLEGWVDARRRRHRGAVRRPHRLLHAARGVPDLPAHRDDDAPRRDLPVDRRRQAARRGRVAREGDRADLPARDPDERAGDRRLRPADRRHVPQLRDRLDPQALPRARAEGDARALGARADEPDEVGRRRRRARRRPRLRAGLLLRLRQRRPGARRRCSARGRSTSSTTPPRSRPTAGRSASTRRRRGPTRARASGRPRSR